MPWNSGAGESCNVSFAEAGMQCPEGGGTVTKSRVLSSSKGSMERECHLFYVD